MREGDPVDKFNLTIKLDVNQRVELNIYSGKYEGEYSTQITDIREEGEFVINAPFSKGKPLNIPINTRGEVKLREENGIYILPVRIIDREVDSTSLLVVKLRGNIKKIQERQFFRLEVYERTNYRVLANNTSQFEKMIGLVEEKGKKKTALDTDENLPNLDTEGIIKDISAGGIRLSVEEKLEKGQVVEVDVDFMEASFSTLFGEIIRVDRKDKNDLIRYEAGIKFVSCNQNQRDELTRWLFSKQRELRQKGLL
jgi:c-di-GMP-binding flagellar brake protein YcgR